MVGPIATPTVGPMVGPIATPTVGPMVMGGPMVGPIATPGEAVSNCCSPHVNLGLAGVTSAQAHSYLMDLYKKNACDKSYLEELYVKCKGHHDKATQEPSYLNELMVEDCHAQHISNNCNQQAVVPQVAEVATGLCPAAQSVCTATGQANPACIAAKAQCAGQAGAATEEEPSYMQELYKKKHHGHHEKKHHEEEEDYMELYQKKGHKADHCLAAKSVCTAAGENSPACLAEKAQCENKQVVVVKDSASKCPAAKSVCTATGEADPACIAAKEQCV